MKVGFIGLGNVGGKLAGSLLRNNFDLTVRDLDKNLTQSFKDLGAKVVNSAKELAEQVDLIITCLPSPKICAEVMEAEDGVINGLSENKIWLEMSTTDEAEIKRISKKIIAKKAIPLDGPVSGGCHRDTTGNIFSSLCCFCMVSNHDSLSLLTPSLNASLVLHNTSRGNKFLSSNVLRNKYFSHTP